MQGRVEVVINSVMVSGDLNSEAGGGPVQQIGGRACKFICPLYV